MFDYLSLLDKGVAGRYDTLITNIRSGSNSFFDSYRELIQDFARFVLKTEGVNVSLRLELSKLLALDEFKTALLSAGNKEEDIDDIRDYVLKINKHVHRGEKQLTFEDCYKYLLSLYLFTAPYARKLGLKTKAPSLNEVHALYDEYEKGIEIAKIREEQSIIDERTSSFKRQELNQSEFVPTANRHNLVFNSSYSAYKILRIIFIGIFLVYLVYQIPYYLNTYKYINLTYIFIPFQLLTLFHFINFLKLDYTSNPSDLRSYSMLNVEISAEISVLNGVRFKHWALLALTLFFGVVVILSGDSQFGSVFNESIIYHVIEIVLTLAVYIYGWVYYSHYNGLEYIFYHGNVELYRTYVINCVKYTKEQFIDAYCKN